MDRYQRSMISRGSLVYDSSNGKFGIVLTWTVYGGSAPQCYDVLYQDGEIATAFENELELINENR